MDESVLNVGGGFCYTVDWIVVKFWGFSLKGEVTFICSRVVFAEKQLKPGVIA